MKVKYIVTIDLDKFAELAATNFKPCTYHDKIDVYMNIKAEPEEDPDVEVVETLPEDSDE